MSQGVPRSGLQPMESRVFPAFLGENPWQDRSELGAVAPPGGGARGHGEDLPVPACVGGKCTFCTWICVQLLVASAVLRLDVVWRSVARI